MARERVRDMFRTPTDIRQSIDAIKADLTYRHDGPVTLFVLIARATRKAVRCPGYASEIANALHECISEGAYVQESNLAVNSAD